MRFSIIIPIYNTQEYLAQCINSVLSQEYKDYEVLLIDDGSTDQSGLIADSYAKNNINISVIHKKNGGLSSARNTGLNECRGEYIVFLDSDDYLADNSLAVLDEIIEKKSPDIIAGYGMRFSNDSIKEAFPYRKGLEEIVSGMEFYRIALYQDRLSAGAPYYVYKRSFIEKNNFRFSVGVDRKSVTMVG